MARKVLQLLLVLTAVSAVASPPPTPAKRWTDNFNLSSCNWSSTGRNDYFIVEPGYQPVFEGREGSQDLVRWTAHSETACVECNGS